MTWDLMLIVSLYWELLQAEKGQNCQNKISNAKKKQKKLAQKKKKSFLIIKSKLCGQIK